MPDLTAYVGSRIFDGQRWHDSAALVVDGKRIHAIGPRPDGARVVELESGILAPGFVDLQVNGGGGHLLGAGTDVEALRLVCDTHARFGVTALLPTLITATSETTDAVLAAGARATRQGLGGFLGLHLEGPHLSLARKGAHDPTLIRPMTESDLVRLERARQELQHLVVTVAAETVTPEQIARLVRAGIVVSLGHSDASFDQASRAMRAGARLVTHLFNAMSPLGHREPGLVGAALHHGEVCAGVIADGIHVHPATLAGALRAKRGPGRIFLVSDSMSQAGTEMTSFLLDGRTIRRSEGALRLSDGTLAGADLTLDGAVRYLSGTLGLDIQEVLRMASLYPAQAVGDKTRGQLLPGSAADFIHLNAGLGIQAAWRSGEPLSSPKTAPRRTIAVRGSAPRCCSIARCSRA